MVQTSKNFEPILYKGFLINAGMYGNHLTYYKLSEGLDMDNVNTAGSIEEAKDLIDEKIMSSYPQWLVETKGTVGLGQVNITKFEWLADAVTFATRFNGVLSNSFLNP